MSKKLSSMKVGSAGVVVNVLGEGRTRRRLLDMGVTPGARIAVKKLAPLGDPIEVTIRGYQLTLRKDEADWVLMEVV